MANPVLRYGPWGHDKPAPPQETRALMSKLLAELKRRHVFKVATIYIVGSWLILQVADVVFPIFEIPMWSARLVVILLGLGFPLALILAWVYDLTPEGIAKSPDEDSSITHTRALDWIIGGTLVVLTGVIVSLAIGTWRGVGVEISESMVATSGNPGRRDFSIAVLPFVNMSQEQENEHFADGLSEEILNLLAQIPELKVIGRTSSFAFKGRNEDLRVIGNTLGVGTLLEGSVRKSGDTVRITAQLIDATDGSHMWSDTYDRTMTDIFTVQDDVAAAIIDALQLHVGTSPTRGRPTESTEAYSLFLKARIAANNYEWLDSEALLKQSLGADPEFADAHELLAYIYNRMAGLVYPADEAQRLSGEAAAQALTYAPGLVLAKALQQLGDVDSYSQVGELQAIEAAVLAQPDDARILDIFFYSLFRYGYIDEALSVAERLVDLDPLSPSANGRTPVPLFAVGRIDEGFAALDLFDELGLETEYWYIGEVNLAFVRDRHAIAHFEENLRADGYTDVAWVGDLVNGGRDSATGSDYLDRRIPEIVASFPREYGDELHYLLSFWYLMLGHLDRYYEIIGELDPDDSGWTDVSDYIATGFAYPQLGFAVHPAFLELAQSLGMIDVWEQRGAPDFCENTTGTWKCGQ